MLDINNGQLLPTLENRWTIVCKIREYAPDLIICNRPNDYHPDHRYTGVLLQDAAFMVTVPNIAPDTPALRTNPVFLYFEDGFQKPSPFEPDIVCLPEVFPFANLTGPEPSLAESSEAPIGPFSRPFAEFAEKHKCHVVCPIHTVANGRYYNAAVFIDRHGQYVGQYQKMHPTVGEMDSGIAPGAAQPPVFKTDIGALGAGVGFLLLGYLSWKWLKTFWPTKHVHACSVIANRVIFNRRSGPKIAILSLSIHVMAVVIAWCAVRSISAPAAFEQLFMLVPPIMLITMLPISIAGWGVREATMGLAFGYAGLMSSEGVNISLLLGAVSFIVGGFGGLVWIFSAEKAAKGATPIEAHD